MKKILMIAIIATFFVSCEKEITTQQDLNQETNTEISNKAIFGVTIRISISGGTRKRAEKLEDLGIGDGTGCQGRSICLGSIANGGGGYDDVTGGATMAPESFTPSGSEYVFTLTDLGDTFQFSVHPDDITEEQREITFEDNVFIMDADYAFPEEIIEVLGVESCILHEGTYEVTEGDEGVISFNF